MKTSRSETLPLRGLQYHVRHWGHAGAPKLFMLHGWMDVSASFQFMVDNLESEWHVIAPDWRGFGLTVGDGATDSYWFPDYLGDLDGILAHYGGGEPVNLLGHSMGGNVACLYAGIRPDRVRKLVNLEGFGLPASDPAQAPQRYAKWLDELRQPPVLRKYRSQAEVIARLQKTNPRLTDQRAAFLAPYWSEKVADDEWAIRADPAHRMTNPVLYRLEEAMACWRKISAPVLWIEADDTNALQWLGGKMQARRELERRTAAIANVQVRTIADAGHMVHHDQPEVLAALVEDFLGS